MDAFLVPTSADRYELYSESTADAAPPRDPAVPRSSWASWWTRMTDRVDAWIDEGEDERRRAAASQPPAHGRVRRAITARLAYVVASQRLLWALRHTTDVRLIHPDDLTADDARAAAHARLRRDVEKHLWWAVIEMLLVIASLPLVFVPGPNVIGYYFLFRAGAHVLSWRGAKTGLKRAVWRPQPSAELTALRSTLQLDRAARAVKAQELGRALGLGGLAAFLDRR